MPKGHNRLQSPYAPPLTKPACKVQCCYMKTKMLLRQELTPPRASRRVPQSVRPYIRRAHPRSVEYLRAHEKQIPMCSLRSLTCLQVKVLPRQGMVGPSSDSRPWPGETLVGASSAVNGRACRRRRAVGGDWPAALANVQAATLRENCRPEIASSSEANEEGNSEPPNHDRNGEGSYDRGISHQANWVSRRGRGSGM